LRKQKKTLTQPSPAGGRGLPGGERLRLAFSRWREKVGMRVFFLLQPDLAA
jgi:hypothetical protein